MPAVIALLQVPLPRGITALHWLQGQGQTQQPCIYFSPRQSSAPGTEGAAAAEAATAGAGPVAGANPLILFLHTNKDIFRP